MTPVQRESRLDDIARLVSEGIPRRVALRRIGGFVAALVISGPAEALGAKRKKCPSGHVLCGSRCCPKGFACKTHKGKKTCTCSSPKKVCSGTCLDVRSDPKHCGSCGKKCKAGETCIKGKCTAKQTTPAPTCTDGVVNGNETDVDCGGANCPKCTNGKHCLIPGDCVSGVCADGTCVAPPPVCTADNCGARNGCPACANGKTCATGTDCASGHCSGGVCVQCGQDSDCPVAPAGSCQKATCAAGVCGTTADNTNTPVDDGNPCTDDICVGGVPSHPAKAGTPSCGSGKHCNSGTCISDTCSDGIQNHGETDIDCGGPNCPGCADGKTCSQNSDCLSKHCSGGTCVAAVCNDGIKNGDETDVDCGGSCQKCPTGKQCGVDSDCTSGHCNAGICSQCSVSSDCGADTECSIHTCNSGTCGVQAVGINTPCTGGICNGIGTCVQCISSAQCTPGANVTAASCSPAGVCGIASCATGFANCDSDVSTGCETNTNTSVTHCGACNTPCSLPNATAICAGGVCGIGACNANFVNCNGQVADGCECNTTTSFCNAGTCTAKLPNGAVCSASTQCQSSQCTGGVCV